MRIPLALTYDDVLLVPQYSEINSRKDVDLTSYITPKISLKLPLISINMDTVTGMQMAEKMFEAGGIAFYPRFLPPHEQAQEVKQLIDKGINVIPAVGIKESEMQRVDELVKVGVNAVTIDVAHGHLKRSIDMVKEIKAKYKDLEIIAGVVATGNGARALFEAGADSVRVGVGPGTICTTRKMTGCGVPQITATMDAYKVAKEMGKIIITDGGTKNSGDMMKALAAGANAVTTGSQLAGTMETPGDIIELDGKKYKAYNGSTSKTEKLKQFSEYSNDKSQDYVVYVEGIESLVPYKGSVVDVLKSLEAGIRSGMSYCGSKMISELHEKAKFIRVTPISVQENGAHGVIIS